VYLLLYYCLLLTLDFCVTSVCFERIERPLTLNYFKAFYIYKILMLNKLNALAKYFKSILCY